MNLMEEVRISTEFDGQRRKLYRVECRQCKEVCWIPRHHIRAGRLFCSRQCMGLAQQKREPAVCAMCQQGFEVTSSRKQNRKRGLVFCSRACKDRAQRLDGISQMWPKHYGNGKGSYRERALRKYGARCRKCDYSRHVEMLDVDHVDSNRQNNSISNLQVLCVWCHALKTRGVSEHDRNGAFVQPGGHQAGSLETSVRL